MADGTKKVAAKTTAPEVGSFRAILQTWIPLTVNQILAAIQNPIYIAVIMHMSHPKLSVGALFSYQAPVIAMICVPIVSLNTISNLYCVHSANVHRLRRIAYWTGGLCSVVAGSIVLTPLHHLILDDLLGVPASEYRLTLQAIQIAVPLPALWALSRVSAGMLIRNERAKQVMYARLYRFVLTVGLLGAGIYTAALPGPILGAACITISMAFQAVYLTVAAWHASRWNASIEHPGDEVRVGEILRIWMPLILARLPIAAQAVFMSAALGRLPGVEISLAVWPIVATLNTIGLGASSALNQTAIGQAVDPKARRRLWRLCLATGVAVMLIVVALHPLGGWGWLFTAIEDLTPVTAKIAENVLWLLTPLFFLRAVWGYYWALLVRGKRTWMVFIAEVVQLSGTVVVALVSISLDPVTGIYVAASATLLGGLLTLLVGKISHDRMIRTQKAAS